MRLSKIKLAGFKSFVDPITIDLSSNLTGIVGPNGCGKSNTIDAVRWVMGESSAKHLRGSSMEDVIFNGSSDRKPVGQAFVELIFDNSDASLGGEYAKYSELAIKRHVSRDGGSKYFFNGTRCRRRDITDIFLGTGLGPRSYAIIEQGMISRLIEAKPEELRVYLEEAAGISKYRQRRRETETRIRNTRENLSRLSDLREEVEKHLKQLKRQSNAAERYTEYKKEQRLFHAELITLRLNSIHSTLKEQEKNLGEQSILQQAKIADTRSFESQIEQQRDQHTEAQEKQNTLQAEFYQVGAEISGLEQTIRHQRETSNRLAQQLTEIDKELGTGEQHLTEDRQVLESAVEDLLIKQEQLEESSEQLEEYKLLSEESEEKFSQWQEKWESLQAAINDPTQNAQVERSKMEQLERQLQQNQQRKERLKQEVSAFDNSQLTRTLNIQKETISLAAEEYQLSSAHLEALTEDSENLDITTREQQSRLSQLRSEKQVLTGRLASLETLQQAGLGKQSHTVNNWLDKHELQNNKRLAETIKVKQGWELALETVLGSHLEAITIDKLTDVEAKLNEVPAISLSFHSNDSTKDMGVLDNNTLLSKITNTQGTESLLAGIYCVENLQEGLQQRSQLSNGESIITRDGIWLSNNWLRLSAASNEKEGVLSRHKEIETLNAKLIHIEKDLEALEAEFTSNTEQLKEHLAQKTEVQQQVNELHRKQSQAENNLRTTQERLQQLQGREERLASEISELEDQYNDLNEEHEQATKLRNAAVTLLESLSKEKETLQTQRPELEANLHRHRQQMQELQSAQQQLHMQIESLKQTRQNSEIQISRADERLSTLRERKESLLEQKIQEETPTEDLTEKLEAFVKQRSLTEEQLNTARTERDKIDHEIRTLNEQRIKSEQAVETVRNVIETMKLAWQESSVREKTLHEQLAETDFKLDEIKSQLSDQATVPDHQKKLDDVTQRIQRLGAINLAAIDEYKQELERKNYLDDQNDDLTEALDTLESAIKKIDKNTRDLFRETYEKVNQGLQEMFPRLFGGGKAHLELTDSDLLTTGVMIMAQPPGKRISNIHIMSGGEKALTAVALVFAIFKLNPAPFCMLDEVDAPLDEANVGRYCDLVRHMSEQIQFIFITHNKPTMELAENLIGVTMRESGVSRTVSVNVSEAASIANG